MDRQRPLGSNDLGITRQCSATSKRSGERCRKHAMKGRSVCRAHGGATPRGMASPHWKHGRYSSALPEGLAARYEAALADSRLLSLRDDIALVNLEITEALASVCGKFPDPAVEQDAWIRVRQAMETRRKLVETEAKHLQMSKQMYTAEEVFSLVGALLETVRTHVSDLDALHAVSQDMVRMFERGKGRRGAWQTFHLPASSEDEES